MNINFLGTASISFALCLLLALSSCNDDPIFQSLNQEPTDLNQANSDSVEIILSYGSEYVNLDRSPTSLPFLVGWAEGIEVLTIQEFEVPDTLSYIVDTNIQSAQIFYFHGDYAWGDLENPKLEFNVYSLEDDVFKYNNWDDINNSLMGEHPLASFSSSVDFFSQDGSSSFSLIDTLDFDKKIIARWLQIKGDTKSQSFTSEQKENAYTIAIKPEESSNVISRFFNNPIKYDDNTQQPDIATAKRAKIKVVINDPLTNVETVIWLSSAYNKSFFKNPEEPEDKSFTIQSGATSRAHLFFNLNNIIPKYAGIVSAELRLSLDVEKSKFGNRPQDSILSADLLGSASETPALWDFKAYRETGTDVYTFRKLAAAFDLWVSKDNYGRIYFAWQKEFQSFNELVHLDKYVFYGPDAQDKSKRPKLIVVYYERKGLEN